MRARYMMGNANFLEKRMEFLIFTTPIGLHSDDFPAKFALNQLLKIKKHLVNIRTLFDQINPCELAKIIDKAYIVRVFINGGSCRTPYIGENLFQRNGRNTSRNRIRQLMTFLPFDMNHTHRDLFHVNGEDCGDEEFVGRRTKKGVLDDDAKWRRTA
jgi:hypothetical protein